MKVEIETILSNLQEALPNAQITLCWNPGPSAQHSLFIDSASLVDIIGFLRNTLEFDYLSNVTGVDWLDPAKANSVIIPAEGYPCRADGGFLEVIYHLYSTSRREGPLVLRARTIDRENQLEIPSVVSVFRSAELQEREIFDLYGIRFTNHPDLRRILMWDEFVDHPMRKDYVAPDDYEYEPTPHDAVLERAKQHEPTPP